MRSIDEFVKTAPGDAGLRQVLPGRLPASARHRHLLQGVFERLAVEGLDPLTARAVVNLGGVKAHFNIGFSPCLTRARAGDKQFWATWLQRPLNDREICSLMGVDISSVAGAVSERQLRQLAGNAIPVPLMKHVMLSAYRAWGLF